MPAAGTGAPGSNFLIIANMKVIGKLPGAGPGAPGSNVLIVSNRRLIGNSQEQTPGLPRAVSLLCVMENSKEIARRRPRGFRQECS